VRAAANTSGFSVIATARRDFATEELNWLPGEALDRLGRSEPITIAEKLGISRMSVHRILKASEAAR
jgi:hypothetical protein